MGNLKLLQELEKAPTDLDRWKIFLSKLDEEKINEPATKRDLSETELRLRKEIEEIRLEIKSVEANIRKDMQAMEANIRKDMQAMEANIRKDMQAMEANIRKDMQAMEAYIRKDMQAMEGSIRKDIESLRIGQKQLELDLSKQLNRNLIITISIMGAFLTLFRLMGEIYK